MLQNSGCRREHHVGRRRGYDNEVDVAGLLACSLQRGQAGGQSQVAGGHIGGGKMPRANAGALDNPFVRGLDAFGSQVGRQISIGNAARWQVAAGARNARKRVRKRF